MKYEEFKDKHKGQKIIVCGCGESALLIGKVSAKNPTVIGVNDISRLFTPSYLVCVNDRVSFKEDRWNWIKNSTAPVCFTQIATLDTASPKVIIQFGRYGGADLVGPKVDYTTNSPYIASIIAAHMGAAEVGILGVDFTDNHFFAKTGQHHLTKRLSQIAQEYKRLSEAFIANGKLLVNLSPSSKIGLTYVDIEQFLT